MHAVASPYPVRSLVIHPDGLFWSNSVLKVDHGPPTEDLRAMTPIISRAAIRYNQIELHRNATACG